MSVAKAFLPLVLLSLLAWNRLGAWRDEIRLWTDASQGSPHRARCLANLGRAYAAEGMDNIAIVTLRKALSLDPSNVNALLNLGNALSNIDRPREAAKEYIRALEVLPDERGHPYPAGWKLHNNLGNALREMGLIDEAVRQHLLAVGLNPTSPVPHFNLGRDYEKKGDRSRARAEYIRTLDLNPDHPGAIMALDRLGAGGTLSPPTGPRADPPLK